jgi:hypothetical protein
MIKHWIPAVAIAAAITAAGGDAGAAQALGPVGRNLFERVDIDQDGRVTKQEVGASRERRFERIDADRDGFATADEFAEAKEEVGKRFARGAARMAERRARQESPASRVARLDRDGDGRVGRDEYVTAADAWFDEHAASGGMTETDFAAYLDENR